MDKTITLQTKKYAIEITAIIAGLILIFTGVLCGEKLTAIFVGIGCSLLASSVVSFFAARLYARIGKAWTIVSSWGLSDIFKTRQHMNARCDVTFEKMRKHLDIIAWGLNSFRNSDKARTLLPEKIKQGLTVRILTPHPDSMFTKQQDIDESKSMGATRYSIIKLKEWADDLNKETKKQNGRGTIEVRFYGFRPQDFYFRQDEYIYTGPYLYGVDSQQTISFEYESPSLGFDLYSKHFEHVWNNAARENQNHEGTEIISFEFSSVPICPR